MNPFRQLLQSSLGKKYLMALTGVVLAGFVLGHMAGNVQIFLPPEYINTYGHKLQSLPGVALWGIRGFLLLCLAVHVWLAFVLTIENRLARPLRYEAEDTVEATISSRAMPYTGLILLFFIIFHILHYTVRSVYDYSNLPYDLHGEVVHDIYAMMYLGFTHWWVSIFYIIAMSLLCMHLAHGVSSMFQTMGVRNDKWRPFLNKAALAYGWIVYLGFISIPIAVLLTEYGGLPILDKEHIEATQTLAKTLTLIHP